MAVRSRYTNPGRPARPASEHRRTQNTPASHKPSPGAGAIARAKTALKTFTKYIEKNQRDYVRDTGDRSSLSDDLTGIPMRVIRESGKLGREEQERIRANKIRDSDEEILRFMSGRGSKPKCGCKEHGQHLEIEIKPKPKKRQPPRKVIYLEYDPDAEVG